MPFDPVSAPENRILVIGGGMAGSLLALVLGRRGLPVTVIDPRRDPPPMFRNEKLGAEQIELLKDLGALSCFETACWPEGAYAGMARPSLTDCGAPHQAWLKSVRAAWPQSVTFVEGTVAGVDADAAEPSVTLANGEVLKGRLVVLASGRMHQLHEQLGISLRMLKPAHSACLGFSVTTDAFVPSQIIHVPFGHDIGYVSIFPMPGETRVNLFSYRPLNDPWTRRMAQDPLGALGEVSDAAARALNGARVVRRCEVRGTDLYATEGHKRAGVVLIGDSFHAPCPASGTGMLRILHDIKVLADGYLPGWLATPGMDAAKITRFYDDPTKRALDARSMRGSLRSREWAVNTGLKWRMMRAARTLKQKIRA
jgi:2-polyprenyl-6-methoxyphenol hydroxylase-like FAD-dependent oxidoreductase